MQALSDLFLITFDEKEISRFVRVQTGRSPRRFERYVILISGNPPLIIQIIILGRVYVSRQSRSEIRLIEFGALVGTKTEITRLV